MNQEQYAALSVSAIAICVSVPLWGSGYESKEQVYRVSTQVSVPLRGSGYESDLSITFSFKLINQVSVPLRGSGYESHKVPCKPADVAGFPSPCGVVGMNRVEIQLKGQTLVWFPSPCGVVGMNPQKNLLQKGLDAVSVPLRGSGYESSLQWLRTFGSSTHVSVPLRGSGYESIHQGLVQVEIMDCFRPLAG